MSGNKHLKPSIGGGGDAKKKREKGKTQGRDPRGIPTMIMRGSGKMRMEWR